MILRTFPGSSEEPAEYVSTCPIQCADCMTQWDAEAEGNLYAEFQGKFYCREYCLEEAHLKAYELVAGTLITEALANLTISLAVLERLYKVEGKTYGLGSAEWAERLMKDARRLAEVEGD